MRNKNFDTDTLEENISSANKLFSETFSTMSDIYRKQMEFSYDLFNNFFNPVKADKIKSGINPELFTSGTEQLRKNFENMAEQSRNMMSSFLNLYSGKSFGKPDGENITDSVLNAYKLQTKQIADINHKFFKVFNETFKTANVDFDSLYDSFRKSTEENIRMADEEIKRTLNNYIAISGRSSKDFQRMLETANKQMEVLTKNNMNLWSDLLNSTKKENKKTTGKSKK
ncbi:MAG: phasin family protein [Bacteroidetes bacterium]|nr:phasin family protein [Bacteroidota bacterium]